MTSPSPTATCCTRAQDGKVKDVMIDGNTVTGHFTNNDQFHTTIPANDPEMYHDADAATA